MSDSSAGARAAAAAEVEGILDRRVGAQGTPTDEDLKPVFFFLVPSGEAPASQSERRHWYCSRAGGLERRAATYLVVLFAFKQQGTSKVWIDTLEGVLQGCAECARAFPVARRTWERLYFSKYPAQTRNNFFKAVDRWQAGLVAARLDAGDALLDLPPPLLQLAFNEPGVLASESLSGALDAAITHAPTARTAVADLALTPGLAHLLSSPSAPRRAWARVQLVAIRKPVAYDELRDGGLGDQLATLLSPSFPGTQTELWATLSSLLSTDRLGVDAVQRALLAGQYTPDTPRPDRSAMAAIARHIGTPGDTFDNVFRCFTAALRLSPTHHIWAFDTSPEFPRTLFSEIKENTSFEALVAAAQPSSSKGKGKEGALDASPFAFIPNFLLSVLDVAATNDASGFPGALAKSMSYLFGEMQHDRLLESARAAAAEAGCKTLTTVQERITSKDAGMAALTSVFEVHPGFIARVAFQLNTDAVWASPRAAARDLVAQVFKVDGREILESVMGLAVIASAERRRLKRKRRAKPGQAIPEPVAVDKLHRAVIRRDLWRAAYDAFSPTDAEGLVLLMTAVAPFAHVEKLNLAEAWDPRDLKEVVQAQEWTASVRAINSGLTSIRTDFARVLESLAAQADPLVLGSLWKLPGVAKQAVILLLSPAEAIHEPVINLVQQSFDVDDRADCFRTLLATYSADAMDGLYTFLSSFIHSARIVPDSTSLAKWLVRCFTDIMDALCEADELHPPLLQAEAFLNIYANGRWMTRRVSDLWQLMTDSLALIFRRTADWAPYYENEVMVDWMRDALIFGRMITDNIRIFESAILSRAAPKTADPSESPARMSHVAKGLVAKLEVVLADLVGWLRLTDAETLHQAFELIKTILGRIAKTKPDLAHNPKLEATLLELDKFCRRVSSAYNCRLSDDLLSELSDMLSVFDLPADEDEVQFIKEVKARSPEVVSDADSITSKLRAAAIKEKPIKDKGVMKESKDTQTPPSSQGRNAFAMMMKKAGGTYSPSESTRPKQSKPVKPRQMTLDEFEAQDDFLDKLSANDLEIIEKRAQNTSKLTRPNAVKPAKPAGDRLVLNVMPKLYPEKKPLSSSKFTSKLMRDLSREHKAARSGIAPPPPPRLPNASAIGTGIGAYTGSKPKPKPKPESESSASESSSDEENKGLSALLARQKAPVAPKPAPPRFTINERRPIKTIGSDATDIIRQREEQRRRQHNIKMRLRPDMTPLFRFVLAWDPTSTSSTPPYSQRAAMQLGPLQPVPTTFVSPQQYDKVMLPLFLHELWAQFLKDDMSSNGVTVEVTAKDYEDDFLDYSANVKGSLPQNFSLNDADIVTVQHHGPNSRPVFAKVQVFRRKFKDAAIKLRVLQEADPGTMGVGAKLLVKKHATLSTAMREFGALRGLPYYEPAILSDTLKAHCAAMPTLSEGEVEDAMRQYQVNEPQARAILGAMHVRGFSLIQGPPGTGKTKTISGLVGKFMSDRILPIATQGRTPDKPKILVCAPSNAAIDEVCKRLMEGVPSSHGERLHPKIVRIGIESSVNVAVKDVSLDNIVEARVNTESQRRDGGGTDLARIQTELADVRRQIKEKQDEAAAVTSNEQKSRALAEELQVLNMRRTKLGQQSSKAKDAARDATRHLDGARRAARETVLKEADVICATLSGSGQDVLSPFTFDTVIIDEAAQAIEMSCLIPLKYGCARCVMVGDPNQLPPTTFTAEADRFKFNQSLFVRIAQNKTAPMHLLSIQYRMHPDISTLPSKLFYQGRLKDGDGMAKKTLARWHKTPIFGPYHFINVSGTEVKAGTSTKNTEEARVAVELYRNLERQYGDVVSFSMRIGVITMYKEQLYELRRRFTEAFGQGIVDAIDFNTVDGFQGQEKDIIILSCVRSGPNLMSIGFLKDFRRMNVALTRAKSSLFVIGSAATLERSDPRWSTIVGDARDRRLLVDYTPDLFSRRAITNGDGDDDDQDVASLKKNRRKRAASPDPSDGVIPKVQAVRDQRGREGERKRKADDADGGPGKKQRSSPAVDAGSSANGTANGAAQGRRDSRASPPAQPPPPEDPPPPPPPAPPTASEPAPPPRAAPAPATAPAAGTTRPAPPPRPREAKEVLFMRKKKPAPRPTAPPGGATNVRAAINNSLAGGARGMGSHPRGGARGGAPPPRRP